MFALLEPLVVYLDNLSLIALNSTCKHFYSLLQEKSFMRVLCAARRRKHCTWQEFCQDLRNHFVEAIYNEAKNNAHSSEDMRELTNNFRFQRCIAAGIDETLISKLDHCYIDNILSVELLNDVQILTSFLRQKIGREAEYRESWLDEIRGIWDMRSIVNCDEEVLKLLLKFGAINALNFKKCLILPNAYGFIERLLKLGASSWELSLKNKEDKNIVDYLQLLDRYGITVGTVDCLGLEEKTKAFIAFLEDREKYSFANLLRERRKGLLEARIKHGTQKITNEIVLQIIDEYPREFCEAFLYSDQIDGTYLVKRLIERGYYKVLLRHTKRIKLQMDIDVVMRFLLENSFEHEFLIARWLQLITK